MKFTNILILIVNIITVSCTNTTNNNIYHSSSQNLYKTAQKKLLNKNYTGAIQDLVNLQKKHLFEPCPQQIYLDLIYAYYKSHDLTSANNLIQRFFTLYPNHKHLDYVLYIHGIINMSLDKNGIVPRIHCFNIYWFDRDPIHANIAFQSFLQLTQNYPNSQYFSDSCKRLIFLKNRLAEHELSIIKFYNKRNAYTSVIKRTEKMLCYFPDTQATRKALHYMKRSYQNTNLLEQAHTISKIIDENITTY